MSSTGCPGNEEITPNAGGIVQRAADAPPHAGLTRLAVTVLIISAMLTTGIAWAAGETLRTTFQWDGAYVLSRYGNEIHELAPELRQGYLHQKTVELRAIADSKNSAIVFGLLGGCLALTLGSLGAILCGKPKRLRIAGFAGLILGIVMGAIPSLVLVPDYFQRFNPRSTMALPFLVHLGIWVGIGCAAGLALPLGLGRRADLARGLIGGITGVLAGTLVYQLLNPMLYPLDVDLPIPARAASRLIADLCVSGGAALGALVVLTAAKTDHATVKSEPYQQTL